MHGEQKAAKSFFPEKGIYLFIVLITLFAGALAIRLYKINAPPLDFHEVRQYNSFLIARSFYYSSLDSVSEQEKKTALAARPPLLEPPVIEYTTSHLYRILGGELMIIPRLMSIVFWLAAAAFLYPLARELISSDAAIIAVSFFLFLPYGVSASRSFQPDPLMIMFLLAALYSVFKYLKQPSLKKLGAASVLSAIAAFIKPVSLFPLFGVFIATRLSRGNLRKTFLGRDTIIFAAVSLAPILIYSVYGYFIAGYLKNQIEGRFIAGLYMEASFWINWFKLATGVIGRWPLLLSLTGILLLRSGMTKSFLLGLWTGYIIFGLVFNLHISTHDYYHLMLIPIAALSLGSAAAILLERLALNKDMWRLGFWILFAVSILFSMHVSTELLNDTGFEARITMDKEIGELVNHSPNTIYLDGYFGNRLMFNGKFAGVAWPRLEDFENFEKAGKQPVRGKELLERIIEEKSPDYFIISSMDQLDGQEDVKEVLDSEYTQVAETSGYIIYNLKRKRTSTDTP